MYFFRIGSNITALREFTALCKVDSIPLKKFLLGNHLKSAKGSGSLESKKKFVRDSLVEEMGGVSALGKVSDFMIPALQTILTLRHSYVAFLRVLQSTCSENSIHLS